MKYILETRRGVEDGQDDRGVDGPCALLVSARVRRQHWHHQRRLA